MEQDVSMKMEIGSPGRLESLYFAHRTPQGVSGSELCGNHDVRIRVNQAFLHPHDLETLLGRNTRTSVSADVIGTIVACGRDVNKDEVDIGMEVATHTGGSVRSHVVVNESCLLRINRETAQWKQPHGLTKYPPWGLTALFTAYSAMKNLTIGPDTIVVVRAAAGAFGQAALFVFRAASIIAVVSDEQQRQIVVSTTGIVDEFVIIEGPDLAGRIEQLAGRLRGGAHHVDLVFDPSGSGHMETNFGCVETGMSSVPRADHRQDHNC
jgi:NADPH:quinone reductase-like Zn-dependent oxidoreductase